MEAQDRINVLTAKIYKVLSPAGSVYSGIVTYELCKEIAEVYIDTNVEKKPEALLFCDTAKAILKDLYNDFLLNAFDRDTRVLDTNVIRGLYEKAIEGLSEGQINKIVNLDHKLMSLDNPAYIIIKERLHEIELGIEPRERLSGEERQKKIERIKGEVELTLSKPFYRWFNTDEIESKHLRSYITYLYQDRMGIYETSKIDKKIADILKDLSERLYITAVFLKNNSGKLGDVTVFNLRTLSEEYQNRFERLMQDIDSGLVEKSPLGPIGRNGDKTFELNESIGKDRTYLKWRIVSNEPQDISEEMTRVHNIYSDVLPDEREELRRVTSNFIGRSNTLNIYIGFYREEFNAEYIEKIQKLQRKGLEYGFKINEVSSILEADVLLYIPASNNNDIEVISFAEELNSNEYYNNLKWNIAEFPESRPGRMSLEAFHPDGERVAICDIETLNTRIDRLYGIRKYITKEDYKDGNKSKIIKKGTATRREDSPVKIAAATRESWNKNLFYTKMDKEDYELLEFSKTHTKEYLDIINAGLAQCNLAVQNFGIDYTFEMYSNKVKSVINVMKCTNELVGEAQKDTILALEFLYERNNKIKIVHDLDKADILLVMPSARSTFVGFIQSAMKMNSGIQDKWEKLPKDQSDPLSPEMLHPIGEKIFICTPRTLLGRLKMLYGHGGNPLPYEVFPKDLRDDSFYTKKVYTEDTDKLIEGNIIYDDSAENEAIKQKNEKIIKRNDEVIRQQSIKQAARSEYIGLQRAKETDFFPNVVINDKLVKIQPMDNLCRYEIGAIKSLLPSEYSTNYWHVAKLAQFYKLYTYGIAGLDEYRDTMEKAIQYGLRKINGEYEQLKQEVLTGKCEKASNRDIHFTLSYEINITFADQLYKKLVDESKSVLYDKVLKLLKERFNIRPNFTNDLNYATVLMINRQSPLNDINIINEALKINGDYSEEDLKIEYKFYNGDMLTRLNGTNEKIFICTIEEFLNRISSLIELKGVKYKVGGYAPSEKNIEVINHYKEKYFKDWPNMSQEDRARQVVDLIKYRGI